jgi:hypothetical protein
MPPAPRTLPIPDWPTSVVAGLCGGIGWMLVGMIGTMSLGYSPWVMFNLIASSLTIFQKWPQEAAFTNVMAGLVLHFLVSSIWGLIFGQAIVVFVSNAMRTRTGAAGIGLLYGIVVWAIMGQGIGKALVPEFGQAPGALFFALHLIYGLLTGLMLNVIMSLLPKPAPARPVPRPPRPKP